MNSSETITKIAASFTAAQSEFQHAPKDSTNPHFKSKYADLATIIETVRPILSKHGLSVMQRNQPNAGGVTVQTTLLHSSGEWIADDGLSVPASKNDAQGFGSALTYTRRYGLASLLCIAQDDDDGNAASTPQAAPAAKSSQATDGTYVFNFGKHKGKPLTDVPDDYLTWLLGQPAKEGYEKQHAEAHAMYRAELTRRESSNAITF